MFSTGGMGGNGNNGEGNSQANQPQGTEYTLQGVMRFLQTEWHRHERDRNGWEIERQEMRGRIANLEGQTRRNTRTTVGLNKYISMLERTIRDLREAKGKVVAPEDVPTAAKESGKGKENMSKKRPENQHHNSFLDVDPEQREKKLPPETGEVRGFLDQCQQEFTYLMVSSSGPVPPREPSPPPPRLTQQEHQEHLAAQAVPYPMMDNYSQQTNMHRSRDSREMSRPSSGPPNHLPPNLQHSNLVVRNPEPSQGSLVRTLPDQKPLPVMALSSNDWRNSVSEPSTKISVTEVSSSDYDDFGRGGDDASFRETGGDAEPWDFGGTGGVEFSDTEQKPQRPDTDLFPMAQDPPRSPGRGPNSHKRKTSGPGSLAKRKNSDNELSLNSFNHKAESGDFKARFGLRGHLDAVRAVIFTGGGSPSEPEICTAGDDGSIKRWIIPARYENHVGVNADADLDIQSYFTHRGHTGSVMALASWSPSQIGGRAQGDGWVFSGGQDASIRVWERGRVDPKATLDGHTDAVWAVCVLPGNCGTVFGPNNSYGGPDRILLVSGAADATVRVWSISPPPQLVSPGTGSGRRGGGGRIRGNSMSSGTGFPTSPQPSTASSSPFHYTLIHTIQRLNSDASPTCITPLSSSGDNFVVAYSDAAVLVYDTRTGEELVSMASQETYDGTINTGINAVVATTLGLDGSLSSDSRRAITEEESVNTVHGATGSSSSGGLEGVIISGHEDRFIRFYDANSGQCTYTMLAHPAAISALSLSPDGRELVSAGHDASLRFWSLEKRNCTQEIVPHRLMRGEGVTEVVWSLDGRFVLTGGGDSVVKVFAR